MKKYLFLSLCAFLSACATKEIISPDEYDPTKHARLRIFAVNGNGAGFYVGIDCKNNKNGSHIIVAGLDKFLGVEKQKRIGMTQTKASDIAQANNNMFSEYIIPAGMPVNIFPEVTHFKPSCPTAGKPCITTSENLCKWSREPNKFFALMDKISTFGLYDSDGYQKGDDRSFIPEAGKQYEYIPSGCSVTIKDITEEEPKIIPLTQRYRCK